MTPPSHSKYTITKAKDITTPEEWGNFLKPPVTTQKQTAPHTLISIKMQQKSLVSCCTYKTQSFII